MAILEPLRRGAEELMESLGEGWEWLRERSSTALTRFRRRDEDDDWPEAGRGDRWGLLASDVAELDDEIVVRIEAPGMEKDDFEISVDRGHLVVRGAKRFEREDRRAHYHLVESAYGAFERRLPLPCTVEADRASARYRRGVLTIRLPRSERDTRRHIRVASG